MKLDLKKYSKYTNIKNIDELKDFEGNYFNAIISLLKKAEAIIIVPALFPSWLLMKMIKSGLDVQVKDYYFFQQLLHKSVEEIKMIKKTAKGVRDCFDYIENILANSISQNNFIYYKKQKLSSKILSALIDEFFLSKDIKCEFSIVACGKYAYYPHSQINHFLKPGKTIIIDLAARNTDNGYYIDVSRTYCVGKLEYQKFIDLYNCIKKAKLKLEENACHGKLISIAYNEAVNVMSEQGIRVVKRNSLVKDATTPICYHSLGHGVDRKLHQLPVISKNATVNFEENMVVTIEPGAYIKGCGGVRIEDTYLITKHGAENLTGGKYNFLINQK